MGSQQTIQKCNFEDIQSNLDNFKERKSILINTLPINQQECLIPYTLEYNKEEETINHFIKTNISIQIYIYGKNTNDESIYKKYNQLISLGFQNVYLYIGGLFEWVCLQDIYGDDIFPTTYNELDILKFKPLSIKNIKYIQN